MRNNQDKSGIPFCAGDGYDLTSCGSTNWQYLSQIFAVHGSRKTGFVNERPHVTYQTTREGLERVLSMTYAADGALSDAVGAIGELMAYANHREVSEHTHVTIGWLMRGLNELHEQLNEARAEAEYALHRSGSFAIPTPIQADS